MKDYLTYLTKSIFYIFLCSALIYLVIPAKYSYFWFINSLVSLIYLSLHLAYAFSLKQALQIRHLINLNSKFSIWQDIVYYLLKLQKRYQIRYKNLQNKHDDFMKAIEASPNGVIILDNDGYIKWLNHRIFNLLNISKKDIGQRLQHLIRNPIFVEYWQNPNIEGIKITTINNILHVKILNIDEANLLFLVQDITQRQKLESMQKDFIANASHEISTPLSSIIGFSETIQSLSLTPEQIKHYLSKIHTSALNLQYLVRDLLLIAQIENQVNRIKENFNIYSILKNIYKQTKEIQSIEIQHNITWKEEVNDCNTCIIFAVKNEIISAIKNLVNNAIKYTAANGTITIGIQQKSDLICIYIQDNGIGIEQEYLSDLTQRFFRVPNENNQKIYGTGLGLAIVYQVVQKNNAKLEIKSQIGVGSCFCLYFPQYLD